MRVPNLHTAPKKIDFYLEKYNFARRFEGFKLTKFLEILHSKHSNFLCEPF